MTKNTTNQTLIMMKGVDRNVLQLRTEDYAYDGRTVQVNGKELTILHSRKKLFTKMLNDPNFEVMEYRLSTNEVENKVVGITFSHINDKNYVGIILGLDYTYVKSHDLYKQLLYRTRKRAQDIGCDQIYFEFTASGVKQKFGAIGIPQVSLIQLKDHYSLSVLSLFADTRISSQHQNKERVLACVR